MSNNVTSCNTSQLINPSWIVHEKFIHSNFYKTVNSSSRLVTFRLVVFAGVPPDCLQALLDVVAVESGLVGQQSIKVEGRMFSQVACQCLETLHDTTHNMYSTLTSTEHFAPQHYTARKNIHKPFSKYTKHM